jgi:hypothetical protein
VTTAAPPPPRGSPSWVRPEALIGLLAAVIGLIGALIAVGAIDPADFPWWPWPRQPAVLYAADWGAGVAGWPVPAAWRVADGTLTNFDPLGQTGVCPDQPVFAPWEAGTVSNYAVETRLSVSRPLTFPPPAADFLAGIVVRSGYHLLIGMVDAGDGSGRQPGLQLVVNEGGGWHILQTEPRGDLEGATNTYRVEVRDELLQVWINAQPTTLRVTDSTYRSGGQVGLGCRDADIFVESFRVLAI